MPPPPSIAVDLCGIPLRSPIMTAAGTAGTLAEMKDVIDPGHLGAIVTKSITRAEREGNPFPRITWTRAGMLNAIGLANPGIDRWESEIAPRMASVGAPVICSVAGGSPEDYAMLAGTMDRAGSIAIELNVSCPNVRSGTELGADPESIREVVTQTKSAVEMAKLFIKLSPVTVGTPHSIVDLAQAAIEAGADAITLCNTVPAMGIDIKTRKPILANTTGGLSGPAIHPIVVRLVHMVFTVLGDRVPIIAAGGVTRWQDAAEFVLAGATAVQVGAGLFADPRSPIKMNKGLDKWVRAQGCSNIGELVGQVAAD